ncbi:MAG: extradiol ring-cleavage dioxygenase [Herminiimonas sp.]|jgi:aromatic ring-opening dioxygenase catalytic subunit (LigB family)|nr:extradiol ring-cleavage dioxygenase [Herminiimonas sp.]
MTLAFAAAANHAPGIASRRELAEDAQKAAFFGAYAELAKRFEAARLDALIVITAEHFSNFFMNNMPSFCIGLAEDYLGPIEDEHFLKIPKRRVPGAAGLARAIARDVMADIDLSHSEELVLDHGLMVPLHLLAPQNNVPVIPLIMNCLAPPLAPLDRCYRLGQALGRAIAQRPERIGILATGGLSHWPAMIESGRIGTDFDQQFVDAFMVGDRAGMTAFSDDTIVKEGGPGGHEIRAWVALAGAIEGRSRELLCYLPIPAYAVTGAVLSAGV